MTTNYSSPRYYEIAFDMNRKQEVDFLAHCFRRFAKRPVKTVIDIACGTGPRLIRLGRRGYQMSGLDLSRENIDFLRERAAEEGLDVRLHVGDMTRFTLPWPVDAAICMQDSQGHLLTNEAILAHLRCVARAVKKGGLYVFDRYMCSSWTDPARRWSWTRTRGRATVRATFEALKDLNPVTQTFFEDMELEAHETGSATCTASATPRAWCSRRSSAPSSSWREASSSWSGSTDSSRTSSSIAPTTRC